MYYYCYKDVAQLVKRRTGTPLALVPFPGTARVFLPESTFSADSLTCVRIPLCAIAYINICAHVKHPRSPCQSSVDYGKTKTPSMCCVLGSTTLSRLAFSGESNQNFLWEKSQMDITVVEKKYLYTRGHRGNCSVLVQGMQCDKSVYPKDKKIHPQASKS